jgi:hypothetical protein
MVPVSPADGRLDDQGREARGVAPLNERMRPPDWEQPRSNVGAVSEPYVSAEVRRKNVVVVNLSADRPVGGVVWRFDEEGEPSPLTDKSEPPAGGLVLPPRGTHTIALWTPVFGVKPVKVVTRWVDEGGARHQHTSRLSV